MNSLEKEWRPADYLPLPPSVSWVQRSVSSTARALPQGVWQLREPDGETRARMTLLARLLGRRHENRRSQIHDTAAVS
ncbi:MAG: hypothetical protein ACLQUY_18595 [Ktedonobacterales bacterium]